MITLGINALHRLLGCARKRGTLLAAVEEERFRRIEHWAGFPSQSIAYWLREAGVRLGDVDHIAVNMDNRANRMRKLAYDSDILPISVW
jgi:carbamoyltransferase